MSDRDGNTFVWFLAGLGIGAVVEAERIVGPALGAADGRLHVGGTAGEACRIDTRLAQHEFQRWRQAAAITQARAGHRQR